MPPSSLRSPCSKLGLRRHQWLKIFYNGWTLGYQRKSLGRSYPPNLLSTSSSTSSPPNVFPNLFPNLLPNLIPNLIPNLLPNLRSYSNFLRLPHNQFINLRRKPPPLQPLHLPPPFLPDPWVHRQPAYHQPSPQLLLFDTSCPQAQVMEDI